MPGYPSVAEGGRVRGACGISYRALLALSPHHPPRPRSATASPPPLVRARALVGDRRALRGAASWLRVRDAACPLSTRGGTRLVRLVRGRGTAPSAPGARQPRRRSARGRGGARGADLDLGSERGGRGARGSRWRRGPGRARRAHGPRRTRPRERCLVHQVLVRCEKLVHVSTPREGGGASAAGAGGAGVPGGR